MDVRCERCQSQYAVDDGLVQQGGLVVRCSMCGHSFKVMKSHGWSLRKTSGDVYPLPDSATLQRWVVEGRVTRDDEVAEPGQAWVKAGQLRDLEPFFAVVDQARRARAAARGSEARSSDPLRSPVPARDPHRETPARSPHGEIRTRDRRSDTGELELGTPHGATATGEGWQAPMSAPVTSDEPAWAAGPVSAPVDATARKRAPKAAKNDREPRRRRWPSLVLLFALLVVLGVAAGATLFILAPELLPANFSRLVQDWNPWGGTPEKPSSDGPSRVLPPVVPGAPSGAGAQRAPTTVPPPAATTPPAPPAAAPAPAAATPPTAEPTPAAPRPTEPPQAAQEAPAPAAPAPGATPTGPDGNPEPSKAPPGPAPAAAAPPGAPTTAESATPAAPATQPSPATPGTSTAAPSRRTTPATSPAAPKTAPRAQAAVSAAPVEKKAPAAKTVNAQLAQARQLRDRGQPSAALDVYARALQANPGSADAHAGRGLAYLDLSQYRQAEDSFKAALEIDPSQPAALMGLAETYRYQGKRSEAVALYRRYVAAHPKGEDATAARKAIQSLEESP